MEAVRTAVRLVNHPARTLALGFLAVFLGPAGPISAQVIQGHLYDTETHRPVINGAVGLLDEAGTVVGRADSDSLGAYRLRAPEPGRYTLLATGLGYRSTPTRQFEVGGEGVTTVDVYLYPKPIELDSLTVETERQRIARYLQDQGFYSRKAMGFGYFITPEEIERRFIRDWHRLFERTPVETTGALSFNKLEMRGRCRGEPVSVFVNGLPLSSRTTLEEVVDIADVLAVEVFSGIASTPLEWTRRGVCGTILIWTKGDSRSTLPVRHGIVSLLDTLGIAVAGVLTDPDGRFTLRAPGPEEHCTEGRTATMGTSCHPRGGGASLILASDVRNLAGNASISARYPG